MSARAGKGNILDTLLLAWPYVTLVLGLALLGTPVATDLWEAKQASESISEIEATYDAMGEVNVQALWDGAAEYNRRLLAHEDMEGLAPYSEQLSFPKPDMIAHLVIPKLSLDLPIYHGTEENTLMIGVGHLEGTALPVGTVGGRCVLAGHSGMPNARMFDDIHLLEKGDRFVVWTLGNPLAYEVCDIQVVTPEHSELLLPEEGEDLVTLVTCTPYRVNTHRLLVTGKRCDYIENEEVIAPVEVYVNKRTGPLLIGLAATLFVGVSGVIGTIRHKRKKSGTTRDEVGRTGTERA